MDWALWGVGYLRDARVAVHEDFNNTMNELREAAGARRENWYACCKRIVPTLYHYSQEFVESTGIPSERFASPDVFDADLTGYLAWITGMADELDREFRKYETENGVGSEPFLLEVARRQVGAVTAAVQYVHSRKPAPASAPRTDVDLVVGLARRFHESVLCLGRHPHKGTIFAVRDEWDCQYLFRSILAAYVADVRGEEWNPSVAGSSARCEFFLKAMRTMVELKFVRKASDARKIKAELATDLLDYGRNPQVDCVVCLIYDPTHAHANPAALQADLSLPTAGLQRVEVVISPPRG